MFTNREIAQVCHEANRAYQQITGDPVVSDEWDKVSASQRDSAVEGVRVALNGATPEELHESWCQFKIDNGWRYGEEKDENQKTHPCLVPYHQLPVKQVIKDHIFHGIVHAMNFK